MRTNGRLFTIKDFEILITRWHMQITSEHYAGKISKERMDYCHNLLENKIENELKMMYYLKIEKKPFKDR